MLQDRRKVYFIKFIEYQGKGLEKEKFALSNEFECLLHFIQEKNNQSTPIRFYEFSDVQHLSCSCDAYHYFLSKLDKGIYTGDLSAYHMFMQLSKIA